jgi:hypothetical protein
MFLQSNKEDFINYKSSCSLCKIALLKLILIHLILILIIIIIIIVTDTNYLKTSKQVQEFYALCDIIIILIIIIVCKERK